jgi:hypothetical protein
VSDQPGRLFKLTRKQEKLAARFEADLDAFLLSVGGIKKSVPYDISDSFDTAQGALRVHPSASGSGPWVACRFSEPKRVRNIAGEFNEYSGKWNHHGWPQWKTWREEDYQRSLTLFKRRVRTVLGLPND